MTDPFTRHRSEVAEALASGDADAVKTLYRRFGAYLEEATGSDDEVPVLSYPETAALVAAHVPAARLVLDVGCGPNPAAALLLAARPNTSVVAFDIGEGMVRLARRVARAQGTNVLPVVGDAEQLPFRDGSFGALVCDDTIEHLPHDRLAVAELARVLRRGGTAVAATPNRIRIDVLVARVRDTLRRRRRPPQDYFAAESHLREYTVTEFKTLLETQFAEVRMVPNGWPVKGAGRLVNTVIPMPGVRRLSRLALGVAKKVS